MARKHSFVKFDVLTENYGSLLAVCIIIDRDFLCRFTRILTHTHAYRTTRFNLQIKTQTKVQITTHSTTTTTTTTTQGMEYKCSTTPQRKVWSISVPLHHNARSGVQVFHYTTTQGVEYKCSTTPQRKVWSTSVPLTPRVCGGHAPTPRVLQGLLPNTAYT